MSTAPVRVKVNVTTKDWRSLRWTGDPMDAINAVNVTVPESVSVKTMCEAIEAADFLRFAGGYAPTAKQIFEYSMHGELSTIFLWYQQALLVLARTAEQEQALKDDLLAARDSLKSRQLGRFDDV